MLGGGPSSRPLNRGGGRSPKNFFSALRALVSLAAVFWMSRNAPPKGLRRRLFGPQFGLKITGQGGGAKGTWKQEIKQLQLRLFHLSFQLIFFAKLSNKIKCEGFFFSSFRFPFLSHTLTLINAQHYTPSSI